MTQYAAVDSSHARAACNVMNVQIGRHEIQFKHSLDSGKPACVGIRALGE